jgi:hypothetical protein
MGQSRETAAEITEKPKRPFPVVPTTELFRVVETRDKLTQTENVNCRANVLLWVVELAPEFSGVKQARWRATCANSC